MPYEKKIKEGKIPPDIYKIYSRQRMGADAATQELTPEKFTNQIYPSRQNAVKWIEAQDDHSKVFVIRNRKEEMLVSYAWKHQRKVWGPINMAGYFGGFKIGNPTVHIGCELCGGGHLPHKDPKHPCYKKPQESS